MFLQELLQSQGDTDEEILKRMEEILFTYKCKVEDKLAAEGKQLPKVRVQWCRVSTTNDPAKIKN